MNKRFDIAVLITLAGLLAAACTKVERNDVPERISFSVGSYAAQTKTSSYKDTENLEVFNSIAYLHAEGAAEGTVLFNSSINWDGETWSPANDYFWPKHPASYLNFVSWYANDGSADIVPNTVNETTFSILNRTIGAQDRILLADEAWRQTSNSATYNYNGVTSGVPTLFRHLLSRVKVNMCASLVTDPNDNTVTYQVTLQDVHFEGIYRTGSLSLNNADPRTKATNTWHSLSSPNYLWAPVQGSNTGNIVMVNSNTTLGTSATTILPERSFMPQALGSAIKMVITYTVETKSNGVTTSTEYDIPATIIMNTIKNSSDMAINQWVPNKIYTYNIAINPISQEILLNPTVDDWASDVNTINITVE